MPGNLAAAAAETDALGLCAKVVGTVGVDSGIGPATAVVGLGATGRGCWECPMDGVGGEVVGVLVVCGKALFSVGQVAARPGRCGVGEEWGCEGKLLAVGLVGETGDDKLAGLDILRSVELEVLVGSGKAMV